MSGRKFILGFLVLLVIFTAGLIYTQFYAYYERDRESEVLRFGDLVLPVQELDLIDASTSPAETQGLFPGGPSRVRGFARGTASDTAHTAAVVLVFRC